MKKILIFLIGLIIFIPNVIFAKTLNIYLFHGETCPHCIELKSFLNDYLKNKKNIVLNEFEVWNSADNYELFSEIKNITNVPSNGVPYLIVGEKVIIGYSGSIDNENIINTINYYLNTTYNDKVGEYISNREELKKEKQELASDNDITEQENNNDIDKFKDEIKVVSNENLSKEEIINSSQVNSNIKRILKSSSNLISSIVLGLISTFNISYLLLILLLIGILLTCSDKKNILIVGISFLISIILSNILVFSDNIINSNLFDKTIYIKVFLAFFVSVFGIINLLKYFKNKKIEYNNIVLFIICLLFFTVSNVLIFCSNMEPPMLFKQIININILNIFIYTLSSIVLTILIYILFAKLFSAKNNKYKICGSILIICLGLIILFLNN